MSLSRFLDYTGALDEDLEYLSNTGVEKIQSIIADSIDNGQIIIPGIGTVTSVNNILPNAGNVNLTTDDIPAGTTNKYVNNSSLNDLNDVTITNVVNGNVLYKATGGWINS
ncbi:MAG: hypothetical protein ACRCX2_22875, partial [Paraclostridium sp.]